MINDNTYFEKYIKYKKRYIELKTKYTQNPNIKNVILVATHSYRLQCILNRLRIMSTNKTMDGIKRFKNCAIVRIFRSPTGNTCVELFFEGIYAGPPDPTHFEEPDREQILFEIEINYTNKDYSISDDVEIYLIRHGEGEHNIATGEQKHILNDTLKDAKLTDNGNKQARTAGDKLNSYFSSRIFNPTYYFCASDLSRTQETIANIKYVLNNNRKGDEENPIFIIPCIHEITPNVRAIGNATEDNCDDIKKLAQGTSIYNTTSCSIDTCKEISINIDGTKHTTRLDWTKYTSRENCSSQNIIKNILTVIPK
jgi:broad specificity phosphatase PhoE